MSDLAIRTCPPEKRHAALELVLQKVAPEQRGTIIEALRPVAEQGVDIFTGLTLAERGRQVVGAAWLQPQVGRTATLWPPVVIAGIDRSDVRLLADHALAASRQLSAVLLQTLLESEADPFADDLAALGFSHLANLKYLSLSVPKQVQPPESGIALHAQAADRGPVFEDLIVESYQGTLDCPALEGLRDIRDVLDGYRTIGVHDPSLWYLAEWKEQLVGVLLLAPYPESKQWELVYMGVVPRMRGHQLGRRILDEVRYRASMARIEQVVLAVDENNAPALHMYDAAGFVEWTRRAAYIKSTPVNSAD